VSPAFREAFGKRLTRALAEAGMTQAELARRMKVSPGAVTRWMTGETMPELERFGQLAGALGADNDYLLGQPTHTVAPAAVVELGGREFVTVPISLGAAAGRPRFEPEGDEPTRLAFRRQWVQQFTTTINDRNVWLARITGHSMHPTIRDGGMVLVTRWSGADREELLKNLENGRIYLLQDSDEGHTVKRLALVDHKLLVYSDNPAFRPYAVDLEDGRVRWIANEEP